jgi:rhodanese-related sulfurtransferase
MSSVIQRGSTIYELVEFEHAYAPPYSSAKDPVNMAGFVAENILNKQHEIFYWNEIESFLENTRIIDVRTKDEFEKGHIPSAINIPVDDLRNQLSELPVSEPIYLYCQGGLRGYLAQKILKQNDFKETYNLSGGYQVWATCELEKKASVKHELELA